MQAGQAGKVREIMEIASRNKMSDAVAIARDVKALFRVRLVVRPERCE
jgi:hypothetical protein